ncbi:G-type lectin S-receptor-like serine/threonine-protein kinase [Tanacetum coccineum]
MEYHYIPTFFLISLFLLILNCVALDTISISQVIKDGQTIVSNDDMYELGFFSPGKSKNRYLGIWFKKISKGTVVWVANRETPITDTSGMLKVSQEGNLVILNGGNKVIWSSNTTATMTNRSKKNVTVQLLYSGNLVLWDKNSTNPTPIWQSFDYPTDTLLARMRFGKDLVTGLERYMTSWKSPDDPSIGVYKNWVETSGYPQIFGRKGPVILSRLGPWNGLGFSGFPIDIPNPVYYEFVVNQKEIYNRYELTGSVVQRIVLTWDGRTLILHWIERTQEWIVYADPGVDSCARFEICGAYGSCSMTKHPPCSCMEGFEPKFPQEWQSSDWSNGCQRKKHLDCGSEYGFQEVSGVKLPDTRRSWYNYSMSLRECEMACRMDCSCTAYSNLDIRNGGSGCLLWFGELMDVREYDEDHYIYIKMPASKLAGKQISHY